MSRILLDWQLELGQLSNDTNRQFELTNWGLVCAQALSDMNLSLPTKTAVRLCLTWGETAYRLVFPESWYDEVPETKDTNGLKDVLHLWVFNGFQKLGDLGDWKNLNTSISLLYSGFLAFSRLYFQHSHPNEVQKMQLLATYAKNMKKRLIAASQEIWTSTFWMAPGPCETRTDQLWYGRSRTVRVLDPSIRSPWDFLSDVFGRLRWNPWDWSWAFQR